MSHHRISRPSFVAALAVAHLFVAGEAGAQRQLGGANKAVFVSPAFESWSFGDGLNQVGSDGRSIVVTRATQWSIPIMASIPLGDGTRWNINIASAFASGQVTTRGTGTAGNTNLSISGLSDTKLRFTGKLAGDNVILMLGLNAPSGKTGLTGDELEALRVIAAPALQFQIPVLGSGPGATAGVVLAKQFGEWAWAAGSSYEMRRTYAPVSVAAGIPAVDFNPGDIVHLSLGGDGFVGAHGLSLGFSADFFSNDLLSSGAAVANEFTTQLGPIATVDARLRFATTRFQELSLFVVNRYRTSYKQGGVTVDGSSGNYLDAGLSLSYPLSARSALNWELTARHHTGLKSDNSIATAAAALGGVRLSLTHELGSGLMIQPFARAQFGNLKSGDASVSATGMTGGLPLSRSF